MEPATMMMLGQMLGQMGGALSKDDDSTMGRLGQGAAAVTGTLGKNFAQTQLMNQMVPGQQPAPTSVGGTTMTPTAPVAAPSGLTPPTGMMPDRLYEIGSKDPTVSKTTWDPSGNHSISYFDPVKSPGVGASGKTEELSKLAGGGQSSSPFLEALLKLA